MDDWTRAKEAAKRDYAFMHKALKGYGYGEKNEARATDLEVRTLAAKSVNEARDVVFPLIESSYMKKDFAAAGALEDLMKWFDLFLLEMELIFIWKDTAGHRGYVILMKADAVLVKGAEKLLAGSKRLGGGGDEGKVKPDAKKRCAEMKEEIMNLMLVLKRRRHALGG
jgi:hypothetical protein